MLGTEQRLSAATDLTAWGGRDRAAKVAAAAATIAHGWDRLDPREIERLSEALEDHSIGYLEWIGELRGQEIHDLRGILTTIRSSNALMRQRTDPVIRRRLADMLARGASQLVDHINAAGRLIDLPREGDL
jgi:hypothetical protein